MLRTPTFVSLLAKVQQASMSLASAWQAKAKFMFKETGDSCILATRTRVGHWSWLVCVQTVRTSGSKMMIRDFGRSGML